MDRRSLAVALLILLLVIGSAGAEDVKIMGLMDTNAVHSDGTRPLTYLTGSCQQKHKRMKCHLNEITVNKLDTTLFKAKAQEVMEQVTQDPHNVDRVIERQMPYLCPDPLPAKTGLMSHPRAHRCLLESRSCGRLHDTSVQRSQQRICARYWTSASPCKREPVRCGSRAMTRTLHYAARSG